MPRRLTDLLCAGLIVTGLFLLGRFALWIADIIAQAVTNPL